jgi:hypothetical protein
MYVYMYMYGSSVICVHQEGVVGITNARLVLNIGVAAGNCIVLAYCITLSDAVGCGYVTLGVSVLL